MAWKKIKSKKADFIEQHNNGEVHYYKPILIAMPTCVKCHGGKSDITESTQNSITQKYPGDKAVNYKMGDLRGMWKIKLMTNNISTSRKIYYRQLEFILEF